MCPTTLCPLTVFPLTVSEFNCAASSAHGRP